MTDYTYVGVGVTTVVVLVLYLAAHPDPVPTPTLAPRGAPHHRPHRGSEPSDCSSPFGSFNGVAMNVTAYSNCCTHFRRMHMA